MMAPEDGAVEGPDVSGGRRRGLLLVGGLVLLLIVVRGLLACAGTNTFQRGEEFVRAATATALVGDVDLSWVELFYHPYEGGGFVHGVLTLGGMQLFGPSLLTHKVLAIAWEILLLLSGLLLVREAFGRRAALPFGLLLIFAPIAYQKNALLNLGIHYQALVFQFLLAWAGLCLLRGDRSRAFLCGLIGGFGLFYNYQIAPLIGLIGLAILVRRSLPLAGWGRLVLGFFVGVLPLLFVWVEVGAGVLDIHGQELGGEASSTATFGDVLRALATYLGPRGWIQLLALVGLPLAMWSQVPPERRLAHRGLLVYLVLFSLVIPFSGFLTAGFFDYFGGMRYAPLYGFALVLTAGSIGMLRAAGGLWTLLGMTLGLGLVLLGVSSTRAAVAEGDAPNFRAGYELLATTGGRDLADYFAKVAYRLELTDREKVEVLSATRGVERHELMPAVAEAVYRDSGRSLTEILAELREIDPEGWHDYLHGFGYWANYGQRGWLAWCLRRVRYQVAAAAKAGVVEDPERVRTLMQEGLGWIGTGTFPTEENLSYELDQMASESMPRALYFGFGERCYRAYYFAPGRLEALLAERSPKIQEWVREGFADAEARRRLP